MSTGDSIPLSRDEIDLLASADFQDSAPPDLVTKLEYEAAQAVGAQSHMPSLIDTHQSLAGALRTFAAEEGRSPDDVRTANDLAGKIEQLAAF